jgi:hypothetical protein
MPGIPVTVMFALIAVIFGALSVRDYFSNDKKFSMSGKIRFRMALIFAAVSAYLYFIA